MTKDEKTLYRIAAFMGCRVQAVPPTCLNRGVPCWYLYKERPSIIYQMTAVFRSATGLLDALLDGSAGITDETGQAVPNPFRGMSREELELTLDAAGAEP